MGIVTRIADFLARKRGSSVDPSELAFARTHGMQELLDRLKLAGHYPCSDLDRPPVA